MKKLILVMLTLVLFLALFAGCGNQTPAATAAPETTAQKDTKVETKPEETEALETTEAEPVETTEPVASTEATDTEPATEPAQETTPATETAPKPGEGSELLKDYTWQDGVIVIDGVLYQSFYDPYSKFVENGWDFEFGDRTVKEADVLNAHTYVIGGVHLYNEAYHGSSDYSRPDIYVSFYNNTDENLPYKSCNILGIEVEGTTGFDTWEMSYDPCECYDFEIPGGLRRGSSIDEVMAAYGEPDNVYVSDGHYEILTYKSEYVEYELTVFYDHGLQGVDIGDTRQWQR